MLTPERAAHYERFMQNYEVVRRGESWGADDGAYYRALPFEDRSGRYPDVWRIRAASFRALLHEVVQPLAEARNRPLRILDAGAGNGWLSYRLAQQGHCLLATDLRVDALDGLGACLWYMEQVTFEAAQATFEQLPVCDGALDLVVYGGSIHYAASYREALGEALRVLRDDGRIAILDSPVYRQEQSGNEMVSELYEDLRDSYGIDPRVVAHENFLTPARLDLLERQLGISWSLIKPFYGWAWALAPWLARLQGHREPARFYVIEGRRIS
ncbi:MAG TPA: methyltransferase domain-containing protein [Candidatus Binatia bacterium]|nr:methyltransferase domain-containing protein [Candidatus Binatia bacterium]